MSDREYRHKLSEIMGEIRSVPVPPTPLNSETSEKLASLADQARDRAEKMNAAAGNIQESLDYVRLAVKYLLFDLEATRRENIALRKILQEQIENDE